MNINQLETLVAIAETLSFRKTGEKLSLSQPAVSIQIKNLEKEFQATLVDRTPPLRLTDKGEMFVKYAKRILSIVHQLDQKLADLSEIPQGNIIIGTTPTIALTIMPRIRPYFQNQFPYIKTKLVIMPFCEVLPSVTNETIDVGISHGNSRGLQIDSIRLYDDHFELIVSPDHSLAAEQEIPIKMLHDLPMVRLTVDHFERQTSDKLFSHYGVNPQFILELSSCEELKRMVELNLGAAIVSKLIVKQEVKRGTLKQIAIKEMNACHPACLMIKSCRYMNSATQQFLNDLQNLSFLTANVKS